MDPSLVTLPLHHVAQITEDAVKRALAVNGIVDNLTCRPWWGRL
jgi:hypothetical protein